MTAILTIVNNGLKSEGLPALASGLYAGTEDAALILQQKANEANKELAREWEWPQLIKKATITLVDGTADYALASDFDSFIFDTTFDQTNFWDLGAPLTPQELQIRNYSFFSTLLWNRYSVSGLSSLKFHLSPTPDASTDGNIISYYYISNSRVEVSSASGTYIPEFTADTNHNVLDEDALRYRIMAHYFRSKGLDYAALAQMALERSNERLAALRGAGPIYACRNKYGVRFLTNWNAPNTGYG